MGHSFEYRKGIVKQSFFLFCFNKFQVFSSMVNVATDTLLQNVKLSNLLIMCRKIKTMREFKIQGCTG